MSREIQQRDIEEPVSEVELWEILGLPKLDGFIASPPKGKGWHVTPPPLVTGQYSRFTKWIELGLPYTPDHGKRYFKIEAVEAFLNSRYGVSITEFKRAHSHMRNHGDAITAIFTD